MNITFNRKFYLVGLLFLLSASTLFAQSPFYIGLDESEIRKNIAKREVKDLVVAYSVDGQKTMAWKDVELKTAMIILFDGLGKGLSCTFLPFTEKDIYEFKVVFNKNHKLISKDIWICKIGNRSYKIAFLYIGGIFKKYGFLITDYDKEVRSNQLQELVDKLKRDNNF